MLRQSMHKVFRGAVSSFQSFPAAMLSALGFALVTMIRIYLDWPAQEAYHFLFSCLHFTFAFGALLGLAMVTAERIFYKTKKTFVQANLITGLAVLAALGLLYNFGGTEPNLEYSRVVRVSTLAAARMTVASSVSYILFIVLAGYHPAGEGAKKFDFSGAFFLSHKAFFTALLYGLVIELGASGVAGAIQVLLYKNMSYNVYSYIATVAGFTAFSIFVGYFPDFGQADLEEKKEQLQGQTRFIEVLFEFIMIPLMTALTLVLLLWSAKTIFSNEEVLFSRLSSIATTYAYFGIWLHIMTCKSESGLAKFYRRAYPVAALIILAFEARALWIQLDKWGLKTLEYSFILMWIFAVLSILLLIIKQKQAHVPMAFLVCALGIVSVLPFLGYEALPVHAQVNRLEQMLEEKRMFVDGEIRAGQEDLSQDEKIAMTDTVLFLARSDGQRLPDWFDKKLAEPAVFEEKLGFEQTWEKADYEDNLYKGIYLIKPSGLLEVASYDWAWGVEDSKQTEELQVKGQRGTYTLRWMAGYDKEIPKLEVDFEDETILSKSMNSYLDDLIKKYPLGKANNPEPPLSDMMVSYETDQVRLLLVFRYVNISLSVQSDDLSYWMELDTIYMEEKN